MGCGCCAENYPQSLSRYDCDDMRSSAEALDGARNGAENEVKLLEILGGWMFTRLNWFEQCIDLHGVVIVGTWFAFAHRTPRQTPFQTCRTWSQGDSNTRNYASSPKNYCFQTL